MTVEEQDARLETYSQKMRTEIAAFEAKRLEELAAHQEKVPIEMQRLIEQLRQI